MTSMPESPYDANSDAVRYHLSILQSVISRMAQNSASCKTWCVTLVAAIMVLAARTDILVYALIALVPTFVFMILDAYYLALERAFRRAHDSFVDKLQRSDIELDDLYVVNPPQLPLSALLPVFKRKAIYVFYLAVVVAIVLVSLLALFCI